MTRVAAWLMAMLPVVMLASACGESSSRARARAQLVDQLVDGGLERPVADCVVEGFFDVRNDDELRAFFDREELTDAEREEFAELGEACAG